jgi:hypothetical protein
MIVYCRPSAPAKISPSLQRADSVDTGDAEDVEIVVLDGKGEVVTSDVEV